VIHRGIEPERRIDRVESMSIESAIERSRPVGVRALTTTRAQQFTCSSRRTPYTRFWPPSPPPCAATEAPPHSGSGSGSGSPPGSSPNTTDETRNGPRRRLLTKESER